MFLYCRPCQDSTTSLHWKSAKLLHSEDEQEEHQEAAPGSSVSLLSRREVERMAQDRRERYARSDGSRSHSGIEDEEVVHHDPMFGDEASASRTTYV